MQAKRRLRHEARERLGTMSATALAEASATIRARIASSAMFRSARTVMLYVPLPGEVDIGPLLQAARDAGKRVALPRVDWSLRSMAAATAPSTNEELQPGRYGVLEPPPQAPAIPVTELDLIVVPGVAFDADGFRLGRGAGFYDRFLGHPANMARRIGAAFDVQIFDRLPRDPWDIPVHAIATESRWIQTP